MNSLPLKNPDSRLGFTLLAEDPWCGARAAEFHTSHGKVETPIFMPVATQAALRCVDMAHAHALDYQVLLANTYHLLLRPGPAVFEKSGGIHRFMDWPRSVLTDSGGFQIFSLSRQLQMTEEGARFKSYLDGAEIVLTPESSIATQRAIGSDIMMVLDHCIKSTSDVATTRAALELTTRWAKRSFEARGDSRQALFGIVQGACYPELRRESAAQITSIPFDGFAIGGLAVGESKSEREDMVEFTAPLLPRNLPRYLMGVGTPIDLLEAVKRGVDMFDCILPTNFAHQGVCFTSTGRIELSRGAFRFSEAPLDSDCTCSTCRRFSRAYLHHLVRTREFVVDQHLGIHNLTFYRSLMSRMRQSILEGRFREFYDSERKRLVARDAEQPINPPKRHKKKLDMQLGDYEVVANPSGYGSVRQLSSGETMHSVISPVEEALALYVRQAGLPDCVQSDGAPITIWDVGLGAATNAMTCIREVEKATANLRALTIVSFERDLDPLKLALRHPHLFHHLRHAAPHRLLESQNWSNPDRRISWRLFPGEFREVMVTADAPDIIWYDPFSYKVDSDLWGVATFSQLLAACADKKTRLFTYTASTAVRGAMLAAGWYVGPGLASGPKQETTVAYSPAAASDLPSDKLLGAAWLQRWSRSDARRPFGEKNEDACDLVRGHPQFSSL
jgi:queuine tRNA-ribosyltransferase